MNCISVTIMIARKKTSFTYLMIVRITVKTTCHATEAPRIDNPDEGSIVLVTKVARESNFSKHLTVANLPASSVRQPIYCVHKIWNCLGEGE